MNRASRAELKSRLESNRLLLSKCRFDCCLVMLIPLVRSPLVPLNGEKLVLGA